MILDIPINWFLFAFILIYTFINKDGSENFANLFTACFIAVFVNNNLYRVYNFLTASNKAHTKCLRTVQMFHQYIDL